MQRKLNSRNKTQENQYKQVIGVNNKWFRYISVGAADFTSGIQ